MSFSASDGIVDKEDVDILISPLGRSSSSPEPNIFDVKSDIWSSSRLLSLLEIFSFVFLISIIIGLVNNGKLLCKIERFSCW